MTRAMSQGRGRQTRGALAVQDTSEVGPTQVNRAIGGGAAYADNLSTGKRGFKRVDIERGFDRVAGASVGEAEAQHILGGQRRPRPGQADAR